MSTHQEKKVSQHSLVESEVITYLSQHPDFFDSHEDILENLVISHSSGADASLIERQVAILRDNNRKHRLRLHNLIAVARDNDKLSEMIHRLSLRMIDAPSFSDVINSLIAHLEDEFPNEACRLTLISTQIPSYCAPFPLHNILQLVTESDPGLREFTTLMNKEVCFSGKLRNAQFNFLFNTEISELQSAAVIPLTINHNNKRQPAGLLAVASSDSTRFQANMGTAFLDQIATIINHAIQRHLD